MGQGYEKCSLIVTVAKHIMCILTTWLKSPPSVKHHLRQQVSEWQLLSFSYLPSPTSWPSPTRPPISLDSGSLLSLRCPADVWLEVETEKEALGVFIEPRSFTRTITTLPHTQKQTPANGFSVSHLQGGFLSAIYKFVCRVSTRT